MYQAGTVVLGSLFSLWFGFGLHKLLSRPTKKICFLVKSWRNSEGSTAHETFIHSGVVAYHFLWTCSTCRFANIRLWM